MAPSRLAKPCNQWTATDLSAYNISVVPRDFTTFFGVPTPPEPTTDSHPNNAPNDKLSHALRLVPFAMAQETPLVVEFALELLTALEYQQRRGELFVVKRKFPPFVVCGKNKRAQLDLCLINVINQQQYIDVVHLLVQEIKGDQDPHAPLIAKAIAAFTYNRTSMEANGLPPRHRKSSPESL